ncbi:hypothetical protein G5I_14720 [Acromyrmex echinatior]|uniref:Uncharacterized protein n=1 Tax=Acromyrmex echinatior TaxID=103372 RepID=F4X8I1_ACREC|nr:hypothetical protein G5I_14720 [Acromyrmex echinatior]
MATAVSLRRQGGPRRATCNMQRVLLQPLQTCMATTETDREDDSRSGKAAGNESGRWDGAETSEAASITKRNLEVGLHKDAEGWHSYDVITSCEAVTRLGHYPRRTSRTFAAFAIPTRRSNCASFSHLLRPVINFGVVKKREVFLATT